MWYHCPALRMGLEETSFPIWIEEIMDSIEQSLEHALFQIIECDPCDHFWPEDCDYGTWLHKGTSTLRPRQLTKETKPNGPIALSNVQSIIVRSRAGAKYCIIINNRARSASVDGIEIHPSRLNIWSRVWVNEVLKTAQSRKILHKLPLISPTKEAMIHHILTRF